MEYFTKIAVLFLGAISISSCVQRKGKSDNSKNSCNCSAIFQLEKQQIQSGKFLNPENCNPQWVMEDESVSVDQSINFTLRTLWLIFEDPK